MSAESATVAEQEYLEIMFWIEEAGLPMTGANIARAMQLSPPTVHEMVGRLIEDGYVERNPNKSLYAGAVQIKLVDDDHLAVSWTADGSAEHFVFERDKGPKP